MARVVCCGEGMLELARTGGGWNLGFGGDTLNTAIHLARQGHQVSYLTALGLDPFSDDLRRQWAAEGLDLSLVLAHPTRVAGLYAITTDESGERSFTYWRELSAAREMFALLTFDQAAAAVEAADMFYFSLISLAILPPEHRLCLLDLTAKAAKRGCKVAFDGNYRPRLWESGDAARTAHRSAIEVANIGLPTLDDEHLLWEATDAEAVTSRWRSLGCSEVVVKLGADGCRLQDGRMVRPPEVLEPVDTSGAGDAFNAGYLGERLNGASREQAAAAGHRLAGWCVMHRGAIPPRPDQTR